MRLDFQIYLQAIANADSAEYCSSLNKNHPELMTGPNIMARVVVNVRK